MTKSHVLKALRVFSQEEVLKLAEILCDGPVVLKKAAGDELVAWNDGTAGRPKAKHPGPDQDNILPFKQSTSEKTRPLQPIEENLGGSATAVAVEEQSNGSASNFSSTEFLLWQRELSRDSGAPLAKREAAKGYSKATEMYVVKTPLSDGKEKIRFASTNGVLVNKKQD